MFEVVLYFVLGLFKEANRLSLRVKLTLDLD